MIVDTVDLSAGWGVIQDVHGLGEELGVYRADWDGERIPGAISPWQRIDRLAHLQLLFAEQPYFGRELRAFNEHPWWYRLEFPTPAAAHDAAGATLRFEGVDYFARVWLNDTFLGEHEGYFEPFEFEAGHLLRPDGSNVLSVQVSSPWDQEILPEMRHRRVFAVVRNMVKGLYEHADTFVQRDVNPVGIWRPVKLLFHDGLRPAGPPAITTDLADDHRRATVHIRWPVCVVGSGREGELMVRVLDDAGGGEVVRTALRVPLPPGETTLEASLDLESPRLWQTWDRGQPALYRAHLELHTAGDLSLADTVRFGARDVQLRRTEQETTFLLNGQPIFLRGTCYLPDVYLSALDRARFERDVANMVRAGINALRVHVHVQRPEFYEVCDRLGVAVFQDADINWVHPSDEAFATRAAGVFRAMVRQLRNHASIVCWICMNEPGGGMNGPMVQRAPGPQLVAAAREMDPHRPIIKGSGNALDLESGDSHNYTGSLRGHQTHFLDIYDTTEKLNTEFGFDAPPAAGRARLVPRLARRLATVLPRVDELHDYQYWYTKYFVEHYRLQKYAPCSGYFQFMWIDLGPQSFYGVYDWWGLPKVEGIGGALRALEESNNPVGIFMEYKDAPVALWAVNDLLADLGPCTAEWLVATGEGEVISHDTAEMAVGPDSRVRFADLTFPVDPGVACNVFLSLRGPSGKVLARNHYLDPFHPPPHPEGHPARIDHELGMRLYWA